MPRGRHHHHKSPSSSLSHPSSRHPSAMAGTNSGNAAAPPPETPDWVLPSYAGLPEPSQASICASSQDCLHRRAIPVPCYHTAEPPPLCHAIFKCSLFNICATTICAAEPPHCAHGLCSCMPDPEPLHRARFSCVHGCSTLTSEPSPRPERLTDKLLPSPWSSPMSAVPQRGHLPRNRPTKNSQILHERESYMPLKASQILKQHIF